MLNALRLAMGVILLPLVLKVLPTAELGMYYVFLSLAALVPLVDFGFGPTIGRFVSYAMGGATTLMPEGVSETKANANPNYDLLHRLLITTQRLYRLLTLALLIILGAWGTYVVELRIHETASPMLTRMAWWVTLASSLYDIYSNWWEVYLRGMNQVTSATRIAVLATAIRLVVAAVLLLLGCGLLSLPAASFVGSFVQRQLAKKRCLRLLLGHAGSEAFRIRELMHLIWPNAWRSGLLCVAGYLTVNANTAICLKEIGLDGNAQYGLSVQLLSIATGMASVWMTVKWPLIGQYHAQHDFAGICAVLKTRIWLQTLSYAVIACFLVLCVPFLLKHLGSGKQILPTPWFALLTVNAFLEMQVSTWGTVILLGNRFPFLWHALGTNLLSLSLSLALIHFTSLGLGALVLGPLIAGCLFNYWYWPQYGGRSVGSSLLKILFVRSTA